MVLISLSDLQEGGGGGGREEGELMATSLRLSSDFFQEQLSLSHAVYSNYPSDHFNKIWRKSVAVVTRYNVINSRRSASHFLTKVRVFHLFLKKRIKMLPKAENEKPFQILLL